MKKIGLAILAILISLCFFLLISYDKWSLNNYFDGEHKLHYLNKEQSINLIKALDAIKKVVTIKDHVERKLYIINLI